MLIRRAAQSDIAGLAELRAVLWPDASVDEHREEALSALAAARRDSVAIVGVDDAGRVCGFAEASLRRDYVNGCTTSPVAFLEGIYVRPECRAGGLGRALCAWIEIWAREAECSEFASDALIDNQDSHAFHAAVGFEETERVVYFRKAL